MRVRILNSAHDDMRDGSKTYRYGYLDKVMSVTDNGSTYTYEYHADGQLARANYGHANANRGTVGRDDPIAPTSEDFLWDGLALIQRGDEQFINEPHVGGGNPVASSKGTSYFNDALGTTVGSKSNGKYSAAVLSAFGESLETQHCEATSNFKHQTSNSQTFFTGKPFVPGLGHAFLMRNYRAGLAKWQTADPMGYPDGWNQLAYCNNGVTGAVDLWGCAKYDIPNSLEDTFKRISNVCMERGNTKYLADVTSRSHAEAAACGGAVVYHDLYSASDCSFAVVEEWTEWKRTGKTRNIKGYTEYEEKHTLYKYQYDVQLILMQKQYDTNWMYKAAGIAAGALSAALGAEFLIKFFRMNPSLAQCMGFSAGVGSFTLELGDWIMSDYAYVPIGLVFTQKKTLSEWTPPGRWVE